MWYFQNRIVLLVLLVVCIAGCGGGSDLVAYVALDREFSEPILDDYELSEGLTVAAKYDVESTKTVGLTNRIIAERDRPICDIFWNNEILNTLRLQEAGLLTPFSPVHQDAIPEQYRGTDQTWYGFAARARILIVNTNLVSVEERPSSIRDLVDPRWNGQVGIAKPLFGTTATHAVTLFEAWGTEKARQFFDELKENNVAVLSGNKQVAQDVGSGRLAFGLTDTDDAMVMLEQQRAPVAIVYPDQEEGGLGTLFIPNTIAVIKNCPHPEEAKALASALLSSEVEARLTKGPSAQIPILKTTEVSARVETPNTIRPMAVDFEAAAARWNDVATFLRAEFLQ